MKQAAMKLQHDNTMRIIACEHRETSDEYPKSSAKINDLLIRISNIPTQLSWLGS